MGVWYARRESVKRASDIKETARNNAQIDRAIEAASRSIDLLCHRRFFPFVGTRYFEWPASSDPWRLWLNENEVVAVTALASGGVTITSNEFFLEPNGFGPPYNRIELDRADSASFGQNGTPQRDIAVTGTFGFTNETRTAGALSGGINSSVTSLVVTDSSLAQVGDLLLIDTEYVIVREASFATTGLTAGALTASNAADSFTASSTGIKAGEVIRIDSEKMLVTDVDGTTVFVKRAWDGTTLAAHSGATAIHAPRTLAVTRAQCGTTAATHSDAALISAHVVPALIETLCIAEAQQILGQNKSENEKQASALQVMRDNVYDTYGRKVRMRVVA